jgi:hypothetical protein
VSRINLGEVGDPIVSDQRLDKVWSHLSRLVKFPEELDFATKIQDPVSGEDPLQKEQPAMAVFIVTSPHPKAGKEGSVYKKGHMLFTVGTMTLHQWRNADLEYRHYANLADPLRPIFAGLVRQHLQKRKELEALDD